jgi:hypothetical protein
MTTETQSMEKIGEEWVEFMTTFLGRAKAQYFKDLFYASLEKYANEQYALGYAEGVFDNSKHTED